MKIAAAQIENSKGKLDSSFEKHKLFIERAAAYQADLIFFPELSLTGYKPSLAQDLAFLSNDQRLDIFQELSDINSISIGLGVPVRVSNGVQISMAIFQAYSPRTFYSKQLLHSDELPFFTAGKQQVFITIKNKKLAPAICYESLQNTHIENAYALGAEIYLASVAKPQNGIDKANQYFPQIAKQYSMPILMANCIGVCDDFLSVGNSGIWNKKGELLQQLDRQNEGLLLFDAETEEAEKISMG